MEAKVAAFWAGILVYGAMAGYGQAAPAPQDTQLAWRSDSLNLEFRYPADLIRLDPVEAWKDEHLMVYGIPGGQERRLAVSTACLKPMLSAELPTSGGLATKTEHKNPDGSTTFTIKPALLGSLLLAEVDSDCLKPELQMKSLDPITEMLALLPKVPGMHATLQPTMYLVGKQKIYMAGAQGLPKFTVDPDVPIDPLLTYTMGFATNWNNHLLVWYLSANNAGTLNRMTKSVVKFGVEQAAILYPLPVRYTVGR